MYINRSYTFWIFVGALSIALTSAHADTSCEDKAQNQAQLNECAATSLKEADTRLNKLYSEIRMRLGSDQRTSKLLTDAQRKWLSFRDAECSLQNVRTADGSVQSVNLASCLTEMTNLRVKDFESLLNCSAVGGEQERASCPIPRDSAR